MEITLLRLGSGYTVQKGRANAKLVMMSGTLLFLLPLHLLHQARELVKTLGRIVLIYILVAENRNMRMWSTSTMPVDQLQEWIAGMCQGVHKLFIIAQFYTVHQLMLQLI